ncbi:MAG TPA: pyridoxamine 5'-phosphate oxidase [Burkholderiaceae bacterium]|nr:pyridoxamine 5'-phosphate oxidase [Burkholderiaceae bacterium]
MNIADLRKDYARATLDETHVAADPIEQFRHWFDDALRAAIPEPNAMTLATVDARGRPRSRIVLVKDIDARGLVFYTNYESAKGRELAAHPYAALQFHWVELERQVRLEGRVERVADHESDSYFASRPLSSRIGAWTSPQSAVIPSRAFLEQREREFATRFNDTPPRPPHWGGFRVVPDEVEFWQGRPSRLHDRLVYRLKDGRWNIERLAP